MTYREYVLRKYPEAFDPRHKDLMKGCPSDYGLEVKCNDMIGCKECWNTVITEQETGPKLKVMLDPLEETERGEGGFGSTGKF